MDIEHMSMVLDQCLGMCRDLGRLPYFYITGGDPILNPYFWDLAEMLRAEGLKFTVMGNPFHLTDEVCERLRSCGCERYQLSIDGLRETHDRIRRPGSFDETLRAIEVLRSAGIRCAVMTTVSKYNAPELPAIIDVVVRNHVDVFAFARHCPGSSDFGTEIMTPGEYRNLLEVCFEKFREYEGCGTAFNMKDHLWVPFLYEKSIFRPEDYPDDGLVYGGCNCGVNHLTILPDGDVYACRRMSSKVGNVFEDTLKDIFLGDAESSYRDILSLSKCSGCRLLRFCRGCPAVSEAVSGDRLSADPQCWVDIDSDMYRPRDADCVGGGFR